MYTRLSFRETSHRVPLRSGAGSAPDRTPHGAGGGASRAFFGTGVHG